MTIVVIGPPAAGKSRIGRRLARLLELPFTDTDTAITVEYGPIPAIFAEHGEAYFRELERAAVVKALASGGIVSFGGGAVLDPRTREDLKEALVVLLTVDAAAVAARIVDNKRPLVKDVESWQKLVTERMPLYESLADYTADTSQRPITMIADEIAQWCQKQETTKA